MAMVIFSINNYNSTSIIILTHYDITKELILLPSYGF